MTRWGRTKPLTLLVLGRAPQTLDLAAAPLALQPTPRGGARGLCGTANLGRDPAPAELVPYLLQAELPVTVLAAGLPADHDDARGAMAHAHGGVRGVDALPSRPGGVERLHVTVPRDLVERLAPVPGVVRVRQSLCHAHTFQNKNVCSTIADTQDGLKR